MYRLDHPTSPDRQHRHRSTGLILLSSSTGLRRLLQGLSHRDTSGSLWKIYGDGSKPWYLVNPKIADKWMFIPLKR